MIDGLRLVRAEAWGKHLFVGFGSRKDIDYWVHVHLGLYGKFPIVAATDANLEIRGALRWRVQSEEFVGDLRGPTACHVVTESERDAMVAKLGPDLLRDDNIGADRDRLWNRLSRSRAPIGGLLMDQSVVAGVGNVYRAEVLFRQGIDPYRPGRDVSEEQFDLLWTDMRSLLKSGFRSGRIITTKPEHRERKGAVRRSDAHYVYRRDGLPCRLCGTEVVWSEMQGRNLFWCPRCQPN